jgi:hypothetical protein
MEQIGSRYFVSDAEGKLVEVETEWYGYVRVPVMPKGVKFVKRSDVRNDQFETLDQRDQLFEIERR